MGPHGHPLNSFDGVTSSSALPVMHPLPHPLAGEHHHHATSAPRNGSISLPTPLFGIQPAPFSAGQLPNSGLLMSQEPFGLLAKLSGSAASKVAGISGDLNEGPGAHPASFLQDLHNYPSPLLPSLYNSPYLAARGQAHSFQALLTTLTSHRSRLGEMPADHQAALFAGMSANSATSLISPPFPFGRPVGMQQVRLYKLVCQ